MGLCGTDLEISQGEYGWPPPGHERLVLGHESLGQVLDAPAGSGLAAGDLVVAIVRQPDPEPCVSCAAGEWDMCRNGRYTEHGIKELDGFMRERYRIDPGYAVKLVLDNELVFGTVNANRRHYQAAAAGLAKADQSWLERLFSRRVPLDHWPDALQRRPDDVKAVIDLSR